MRGGNEIATCLLMYITILDNGENIDYLNLYCDSCSGYNENCEVISIIKYLLLKKLSFIREIIITYLLPWYTYMPVDSVHTIIERYTENKVICAPSE